MKKLKFASLLICLIISVFSMSCGEDELRCDIGSSCDDSNIITINDVFNADCECIGTLTCTIGDSCDDNNILTTNDNFNSDCECIGNPICSIGSPCNDGNNSTINDIYNSNCECEGTSLCIVGNTCDDEIEITYNDSLNANCECVGIPLCTVGDDCNDGSNATEDDTYNVNCECQGTLTCRVGEPCSDGNPDTNNDIYNDSCQCGGEVYNLDFEFNWNSNFNVIVTESGNAPYGGPFDLVTGVPIVEGPQTLAGCSFVDMDFLIINSEFTLFFSPTTNGNSSCPEKATLDFYVDLDFDGDALIDNFYVVAQMYLNWGETEFTNDSIPMPVTSVLTKGSSRETVVQSNENAFTTHSPSNLGSITNSSYLSILYRIEKNNQTWTLFEGTTEIAQLRQRFKGQLITLKSNVYGQKDIKAYLK